MTTKFKLSEQARRIISGGTPSRDSQISMQELMIAVEQEFAVAVKMSWFMNKNDGINEIGGAMIYTFKNVPVTLDSELECYYSIMPSSYIDLPNEMGVHHISKMHSQTKPFTRLVNGYSSLFDGLQANWVLAQQQTFYVENDRVYYPNMENKDCVEVVLMKLMVSLQGIDQDTPVNLPPEIESAIVNAVVQKYLLELKVPKDEIDNNSNKQ